MDAIVGNFGVEEPAQVIARTYKSLEGPERLELPEAFDDLKPTHHARAKTTCATPIHRASR